MATPALVEATYPVMTIPVGQLVASSDDRKSLSLESEVSQSISGPGEVDIACRADEQQEAKKRSPQPYNTFSWGVGLDIKSARSFQKPRRYTKINYCGYAPNR